METSDFSTYIADRTRDFTGREWVFQRLDAWLEADEPRLYVITAGPGSGKTALAARLVQISQGQVSVGGYPHLGPGCVIYYHFCRALDNNTLEPLRFIKDLSKTLADRYPPFAYALTQVGDQNITINSETRVGTAESGVDVVGVVIQELYIGKLSPRIAFDQVVRGPLEKLCTADFQETIVILLDSMDEALTYDDENNIMQLLADATGLPRQVRFLLTSRPDDRVKNAIGTSSLDLIDDAPNDANDVLDYVTRRLSALSESRRSELAGRIATAARGNFLYTRYVLDNLLPQFDKFTDVRSLPLPKDLQELYRQFLKRELGRSLKQWAIDYRPLLGVIAVARGSGLTRSQIAGIIKRPVSETGDFLAACDQYLIGSLPEGPFRIYHQSFRDFLLNDEIYQVYPAEANQAIAKFFADENKGNWFNCEDIYALAYTPGHISDALSQISNKGQRQEQEEMLLSVLLDFGFLEAKTSRLGIYALLADLRTMLSLLSVNYPSQQALHVLNRLLDLEAHNLRDWDSHFLPAFFAQQVHNQAVVQGFSALAEAARDRLRQIEKPYLALRFRLQEEFPAFLRRLSGSGAPLMHLAVSPDGRFALAGSDQLLKIWDIETGKQVHAFKAGWEAIGFTSNCEQAVLFHEGSLVLWDIKEGRQARSWQGGGEWARGFAVTSDGRYAVCASLDHQLRLVDLATGEEVLQCAGPAIPIEQLILTPDGRQAIVAVEVEKHPTGEGGEATPIHALQRWDLRNGQELAGFGDLPYIQDLAVTLDGRHLVALAGREIVIWDLHTYQRSDFSMGDYLRLVTISPDSGYLVCANNTGELRILDMQANEQLSSLIAHPYPSNDLAITMDGHYLVSICGTGEAKVWDWQAIQSSLTRPNQLPSGKPAWVKGITPDGRLGILAAQDNSLLLIELDTGRQPYAALQGHRGIVRGVQFTSDSRFAVSGADDGLLKVWDLTSGKWVLDLTYYGRGWAHAFALLPGDRHLVAPSAPSELRVLDLQTGLAVGEPFNNSGEVRAVLVTSDGQRLIGASQTAITVWAMEGCQLLFTLDSPHEDIDELVLTPDGQNLFSFGHSYNDNVSNIIGVYDLKERKVLPSLIGHEGGTDGWIRAVAVTADGQYAISASNDKSIIVWKWRTAETVSRLEGHTDWIYDMELTRDDHRVFSISKDSTLRVWDWKTGVTLTVACLDSVLDQVQVAPDGKRILVGDRAGRVYCLDYFE